MAVFKLDRETTKCRVVFLSNMSEKRYDNGPSLNHNQTMHAGCSYNQKISMSLLQLRFGKCLLLYDLKRAFNQVKLPEQDCDKLLFLWFRNPLKGDFRIMGYRSLRLPFGIKCAPTLLLVSMFKILIVDAEHDCIEMQN